MARRVEHVEREPFDRELVAFGEPHRYHVDLAALAHHRHALRAVAQRAEPGDVVGVQMGVDRLDQPQVELLDQLDIAVDLLQHRIDDQSLAAAPAGEQVGVGAGDAVEQLAKDHGGTSLRTRFAVPRSGLDSIGPSCPFQQGDRRGTCNRRRALLADSRGGSGRRVRPAGRCAIPIPSRSRRRAPAAACRWRRARTTTSLR